MLNSLISEVHHILESDVNLGADLEKRPRFLRELVLAVSEDGLVIDGSSRLHVLWGEAAKRTLPLLIPLMDGSRTVRELSKAVPEVSPQLLSDWIASFRGWGLIETEQDELSTGLESSDELAFLRRYASFTGVNASGDAAYRRLQTCSIEVLHRGPDKSAEELVRLLACTSLKKVESSDIEDVVSGRHELSPTDHSGESLVVCLLLGDEDHQRLSEIDDVCASRGCRWLRIVVDKTLGFADIGPLFDRTGSPCYRCFNDLHNKGLRLTGQTEKRLSESETEFWLGMTALEIVYCVTGVSSLRSELSTRRYNLENWSSTALFSASIPGCQYCRRLSSSYSANSVENSPSALAALFEDSIGNRSGAHAPPRYDESLELDALRNLPRQSKVLLHSRQLKLPAAIAEQNDPHRSLPESGTDQNEVTTVEKLSTLLRLTAGVRKQAVGSDSVKRWAATAGNLGSVEVFLIARNVQGLCSGYYYYQPQEHTLAALQRVKEDVAVDDFMRRIIPGDGVTLPDAQVLFTGAYHRVSRKYGPFGYRLIHLDAGVAISQLQALAENMGLVTQIAKIWADDLIEAQLNLQHFSEHVTGVISIGHVLSIAKHSPGGNATHRSVESDSRLKSLSGLSARGLVQTLFEQSRIMESQIASDMSLRADAGFDASFRPRRLPGSVPRGQSWSEILRSRASVRTFRRDPIQMNDLNSILVAAEEEDAHYWREAGPAEVLHFIVIANRVSGLPPGVYSYDSGAGIFKILRSALSREEVGELYVQEEFADAPVAVWIAGNMASACGVNGAFGHRQLLCRIGMAGNRIWMAAMAAGLSGCLVAGISSVTARRLLGVDGYFRAPFLAVALGYAARNIRRLETGD